MNVAIYSQESGVIDRIVRSSAPMLGEDAKSGEGAIQCSSGVSDATHRVDITASPHKVIAKQEQPIRQESKSCHCDEAVVFSGVAKGSMITINDEHTYGPVEDSVVELSIDAEGEHSVTFTHDLFLDTVFDMRIWGDHEG